MGTRALLAAAASSSLFSAVGEAWTTPVGLLLAGLSAQGSRVPQVTATGPLTIFLLICLRQFPAVQKSHLLELGADFVEREREHVYMYMCVRGQELSQVSSCLPLHLSF